MELIPQNLKETLWRRSLPWMGLACILGMFVVAIVRLHPTAFFGYTEDDSIYFSSAKAIAQGKGYVLLSFPGTPAATKYPVFYPWILSWVWRWNPSFPANLPDAIAISVAFGFLYLIVAFRFLRRLSGISDLEALLLTAFCALHPVILFYSSNILSEIPFAALALAALLVAERATQRDAPDSIVVFCGILVGLAMLTRVFGVPITFGIVVAMLVRRVWRNVLIFCGSVAPFFAALAWRAIYPRLAISPVSGPAGSSLGWVHTWAYYTNYLDVWKQGVPTVPIFLAMLRNNAFWLLREPADYLVSPLLAGEAIPQRVVVLAVTTAVFAGVLRESRANGFRPIHFVLPFYAFAMLLWNYAQAERFLIPFLPLFVAGILLEGKNILGLIRATVVGSRPTADRILAVLFGILICMFILAVALNYSGGTRRFLVAKSKERQNIMQGKREAYEWLSRRATPGARVVAWEDASLYLYSEHTAVRPFIFTTAEFYDPPRLTGDIKHMGDVAQAVGAAYWVSSDDDYSFEWPGAREKVHDRMNEIEHILPIVFRSRQGSVRVHSLGCLQHPEDSSCQQVKQILFPELDDNSALGALVR